MTTVYRYNEKGKEGRYGAAGRTLWSATSKVKRMHRGGRERTEEGDKSATYPISFLISADLGCHCV